MHPIYLDYNASTPLDTRVIESLLLSFREIGNPSSTHFYGKKTRRQLDLARAEIAKFFGFKPQEVIFTSGGTEGASLLINGFFLKKPIRHIISSVVEHACVYETLKEWEKKGGKLTLLPTKESGAICPKQLKENIKPETGLIVLMAANNETGVMNPIETIAKIAEDATIPFIVDGVSWLGKAKVEIPSGVSALFFSGHKIYGPKGSGFILCRSSLKLSPIFIGGGQEMNRRSGTENLPGIVGLSKAIALLREEESEVERIEQLRDYFEEEILARLPDVLINGTSTRICNTSNLAFIGVDGEDLLMRLDLEGICASHGSACSSGSLEPSRILLSMGLPLSRVNSSLRFSFGRMTTIEEVNKSIEVIVGLVNRIRKKSVT